MSQTETNGQAVTGKINRAQAVALARKLYNEGVHTPAKIAERLAEAGYINDKTGKPLSPSGAYYLARNGRIRRKAAAATPTRPVLTARKAAPAPTRPAAKGDRLELVKRILETRSMPAEDRCALALLAL